MTNPVIKPTTAEDVPALQSIVQAMALFPGELLRDMLAPALSGVSEALWLTCHLDGFPVGLCYTAPEEMAEGTWNMLRHSRHQITSDQVSGVIRTTDHLILML